MGSHYQAEPSAWYGICSFSVRTNHWPAFYLHTPFGVSTSFLQMIKPSTTREPASFTRSSPKDFNWKKTWEKVQHIKIYKEALSPSLTSQCLDLSEHIFCSCSEIPRRQGPQANGDKTSDLYLSTFQGIQCISQQLMLASTL